MLDMDPSHPDGDSTFERLFGCGYIRPGDYEVYGVEDTPSGFSPELIRVLLPFEVDGELALFRRECSGLLAVFYVADEENWRAQETGGVTVSDVIRIDKFSYE